MNVFTYDNEQDYWNALAVVKRLGVDYEAQHDELTIVVDRKPARHKPQGFSPSGVSRANYV